MGEHDRVLSRRFAARSAPLLLPLVLIGCKSECERDRLVIRPSERRRSMASSLSGSECLFSALETDKFVWDLGRGDSGGRGASFASSEFAGEAANTSNSCSVSWSLRGISHYQNEQKAGSDSLPQWRLGSFGGTGFNQ